MPQEKRGGRGFAGMDEEKQREIARMGGRAAHEKGSAHEFSSEEARAAGRKGGLATSRDREHMSAIGREGAEARSEQRRTRPEDRAPESDEEDEGGPAAAGAPKSAPAAIALLREDHALVAALFDEFEEATIPAERRRIVEELARQLEVHARLEEQIFYPAIRNAQASGRALVHQAETDHAAVELALAELDDIQPTDPSYETKILELKEHVEHHANEEETEIFPLAQREIPARRLEDLAAQMRILRATLETQIS